jgi:hypothetical protein
VARRKSERAKAVTPSARLRYQAGQVSQILVPQVVGTSDGKTPLNLNVPAGATLSLVVLFSPPASEASDVGTATLNISASTWPTVTVPITWIVGSASTAVNVTPTSISVSAAPGQTAYSGVMIDNVPVAANVLLALASADPMIQVNAVVYLPENRPPIPQELAQMPVTLRNKAQKNGIIQYRQLSSNGLGAPFDVPATARLTINVDFAAPAVQPPVLDANTLIILGNTWQRVEVRLHPRGRTTAPAQPR